MSLAARLRAETRELHTLAERSGIMPTLLRGQLDRPIYCLLLRNFHAIYAVLERALTLHADHELIAPIHDTHLYRRDAVAADLNLLHGRDWELSLPLTASGRVYVNRLHHCSASAPDLLLAHAYLRYLGDLSGGQMLQDIVRESMKIDGEAGTAFYRFGPTPAATLAQRFRAGLDAVPLSSARADAIVSEAGWGYTMHARLFDELAG